MLLSFSAMLTQLPKLRVIIKTTNPEPLAVAGSSDEQNLLRTFKGD